MTKKIKFNPHPPTGQIQELIIYGREDCHLCQDMILALQKLQQQVSLDFKVVDIDSDPELVARFGDKIPVLISPFTNQEICHYFLDVAALDDYLGKFR
ncbi:glutaredoxin family protein [Nitrosomonas supralitoralis]|uniref:Glutaredoxin family protein n=2 Tax=Nitrosomonas supralitoralis TaxID=2116706 RepID=A0A2P7NV26_9PROT|nr:glutaredoxin family protein [Nitrosomonas supralitoralis]